MTADVVESERNFRVLSSLWQQSELLRRERSLEWGVVEQHWAGPISDEQVWRDFGDEAWRRWDLMAQGGIVTFQPQMASFVSRRLCDLASAEGWQPVLDDQRAFVVERGQGERIAAWFGSGTWPRVGRAHDDGEPWLETNDLSAVERVVAGVIRGDIELANAHPEGQEAPTLRWGAESWLTVMPGAPFGEAAVARALERAIA